LIEAARVYRKDKETVDWIVMQDVHDPRAFTIVERFEQESVSLIVYANHALSPPPLSPSLPQHDVSLHEAREKKRTCLPQANKNPCARARNTTSRTHTGRHLIRESAASSSPSFRTNKRTLSHSQMMLTMENSYVIPLLAKPMDLRRHEELDISKDVVVPQ
jgi:hypothetical protein